MWALLCFFLELLLIYACLRHLRHGGLKFLVAVAFGLLELTIFIAPIRYMDTESQYFPYVYFACVIVGFINIPIFIVIIRRWVIAIDRADTPIHQDR